MVHSAYILETDENSPEINVAHRQKYLEIKNQGSEKPSPSRVFHDRPLLSGHDCTAPAAAASSQPSAQHIGLQSSLHLPYPQTNEHASISTVSVFSLPDGTGIPLRAGQVSKLLLSNTSSQNRKAVLPPVPTQADGALGSKGPPEEQRARREREGTRPGCCVQPQSLGTETRGAALCPGVHEHLREQSLALGKELLHQCRKFHSFCLILVTLDSFLQPQYWGWK